MGLLSRNKQNLLNEILLPSLQENRMPQPRKEYVGNKVAIVSTCQRGFDGKYITRVEIPFSIHRKGDWGKKLDVSFITPAIASLFESRSMALEHCRMMCYTDIELAEDVEVLPEAHRPGFPNQKEEKAKKKERLSQRRKSVLN